MRHCRHLLLMALLCAAFSVKSQGTLSGTITAPGDSLLAERTTVLLPELNISVRAGAGGAFVIDRSFSTGYYKIIVYRPGYKTYSTYLLIHDGANTLNLALEPDENRLDEIVVYGNQETSRSETAGNVDALSVETMRAQGALSLSDGIARLPGVSQLSTGAGISKPVIRGLFGNRIQTVLLGLRFDNQQWQDEHGLGLSDIGVDHVEIVKGPATLFYGSEAMGGALNIINEKPAPIGKTQVDATAKYFSNTYGYAFNAGVKRTNSRFYWMLRAGTESHADYSDGNNQRILNSRFGGNVAKATVGFRLKKWISENNYMLALNNFGFIMDAYQLYDKADDRLSRSFERPHHTVLLNIFSTQNTFLLKRSLLKVNAGVHVNQREEQEGASGISLDMLLSTYVLSAQWQKSFGNRTNVFIGSQNQYQTNVNNGWRTIVPDANLAESSVYAYLKKRSKNLAAEGGVRYDFKNIETLPTGELNNGDPFKPGNNIVPVSRSYNTVNGSLGLSAFDNRHFNAKLNGSSGYRGPNLAELSSKGLHEGSVRFEVGNVDLKMEQNFCVDAYAEYYNKSFSLFADAYVNRFLNYIYLQPTNDEYIGFRIYRYVQKNATLRGVEGGLKIHPAAVKFLKLSTSYSGIIGQTDAHEYLPFIPAQKLSSEIRLVTPALGRLRNCFVSFNHVYVFAQNMPDQFETSTPAYQLLNASIGTELRTEKNRLTISLSGNNLSNEAYYDHLSRFKYYGIYNIGRNFALSINYQFN